VKESIPEHANQIQAFCSQCLLHSATQTLLKQPTPDPAQPPLTWQKQCPESH